MFAQHHRFAIWNSQQHPYKHNLSEFPYANPALPPGVVVSLQGALDWLFAVLYPNNQPAVANVAALPAVGNVLNDYRVVLDDGDGKSAGYRWEKRESEATASWHKVLDIDWGADSVLQAYQSRNQDLFVIRRGYDDLDETGTPLAGADAGQHVYGGRAAGSHLTLHANAGDTEPAHTGFIQLDDNTRPTIDGSFNLGTDTARWGFVYSYGFGTEGITIGDTTIQAVAGTLDFVDSDLTTTGTATAAGFTAGTLTITDGSIVDTDGLIDFADNDLATAGTISALSFSGGTSSFGSGTTIADITFTDGSIVSASGSLDFDTNDLLTTGGVAGTTVEGGNLLLAGNTLSSTDTDGDIHVTPDGAGIVYLDGAATHVAASLVVDGAGQIQADYVQLGGVMELFGSTGTIASTGSLNLSAATSITVDNHVLPAANNTIDLGDATHRFRRIYLGTALSDGTNEVGAGVLTSLRAINTGVGAGMSIFWDGTQWVCSVPDTEVDHGAIAGLTDDDHTQYALLAGRAGGQFLYGGTGGSDCLTLGSNPTGAGYVYVDTYLAPNVDDALQLGDTALRWTDIFMTGQLKGARIENFTTAGRPAASAGTIGRIYWDTTTEDLLVDRGGEWLKMSLDKIVITDSATFAGATLTKTYTVDGSAVSGGGITYTGRVTLARECNWFLKDNANNYRQMAVEIDFPASNQVRVTTSIELNGTYTLVGVG